MNFNTKSNIYSTLSDIITTLNNLALCLVHIDIMDTLDVHKLMKDFVLSNQSRV